MGLEKSSWESVREQVVLGGAEFLAGLRKRVIGDGQEQREARRLMAERPAFAAVVAAFFGMSWHIVDIGLATASLR